MANQAHKEDPTVAKQAIQWIRETYPDAVLAEDEFRGQAWAVIAPASLEDICRGLRDHEEFSFDYLRDLCGVDNLGRASEEERFQVVYQLYSLKRQALLRIKVNLPEEDPKVASLHEIYEAANWQEREVFDMYGVRFPGHPDLRRILMPEEFQYYPQRKDFPIEGIPDSMEV